MPMEGKQTLCYDEEMWLGCVKAQSALGRMGVAEWGGVTRPSTSRLHAAAWQEAKSAYVGVARLLTVPLSQDLRG